MQIKFLDYLKANIFCFLQIHFYILDFYDWPFIVQCFIYHLKLYLLLLNLFSFFFWDHLISISHFKEYNWKILYVPSIIFFNKINLHLLYCKHMNDDKQNKIWCRHINYWFFQATQNCKFIGDFQKYSFIYCCFFKYKNPAI